ncbi:MAG: peptidylprolyl isomerase [Desulfobulbaceae bacterium]|nr:peptidylprolyl isomerase [Desulfobulbaceae bacterium]
MITDETIVSIEYTLTLESGEILESSTAQEPLTYTHGSGELMPGLEEMLTGMQEGGERNGTLPPEKGYGPYNPEALIEIPRDHLPPEAWNEGARLQAAGPKGEQIEGVVSELKENSAVVDFNHPLAGKSIGFTVKILSVR